MGATTTYATVHSHEMRHALRAIVLPARDEAGMVTVVDAVKVVGVVVGRVSPGAMDIIARKSLDPPRTRKRCARSTGREDPRRL